MRGATIGMKSGSIVTSDRAHDADSDGREEERRREDADRGGPQQPHERHPGAAYNLLQIEGEPGAWAIGMVERGFRDGAIRTVASHRLDKPLDQPTATQA